MSGVFLFCSQIEQSIKIFILSPIPIPFLLSALQPIVVPVNTDTISLLLDPFNSVKKVCAKFLKLF